MDYTQTRDANWKVPYVGGWCLKYVQDAFGTDHPYASASGAWNGNNSNGNHPSENPPAGIAVPVYFSLGDVPAGHVAISLGDGSVASSTQLGMHTQGFIHPNLQNLIDTYAKYNGGCTYLGWSEYVGTEQVVQSITQGGDNVAIIQDADNWRTRANRSFQTIRGRAMGAGEFEPWIGQDFLHFIEALEDNPEADTQIASANLGRIASADNWQGQITDAQTKLAIDETKIADLSTQLSTLKAQADKPPAETPTGKVAPKPISIPPKPQIQISTRPQTFIDWLVSLFKGSK